MNEDKIIEKLLEHDERLERMESRLDNTATRDEIREIRSILEVIAVDVKKIREDHVFALEWMKRLQDKVDQQEEEIRRIKLQLKMA